jgi:hypothetical protein
VCVCVREREKERENEREKEKGWLISPVSDTAGTLLTVTGGELVSDLRNSHRSHTNLQELVSVRIQRDHNLFQ